MELSQCSVAFRARVGTNTGIGSEALVVDGTRGAEAALPAAHGRGRTHRLLRADRARGRLRCGRAADHRRARRRPLRAQRHQVLHHQRADRRPVHRDGAHRRQRSPARRRVGLPRRARHAGPQHRRRPTARWARPARRCREVHFDDCRVPASKPHRRREGRGLQDRDEGAEQAAHPPGRAVHRPGHPHAGRGGRVHREPRSSSASRSATSSWCRR